MLTTVLIGFAVIVIALVAVIASRPSEFEVTRSTAIAAPPAVVFAQVNDFHKWEAWNPWGKIDPEMQQTYEGEASGVGAKYGWIGNSQVGEGRMTIVESTPDERIRVQLDFEKPMKGTSIATFTFQPAEGGTHVTWSMAGTNNFIAKAIGLVMNMDKMIGDNFDQGLADMKAVAEAVPASATESTMAPATNNESIVIVREFDAPAASVWHAWTDPELVKQWWGPEGFTAPVCTIDLRQGGKYLFCMRAADGQDFWSTGEYREIVPTRKIVYTDSFADAEGNVVPASHYGMTGDWPEALLVTVTFQEHDGKTTFTLHHEGIPAELREMCREAWNTSLDKFAKTVAKA